MNTTLSPATRPSRWPSLLLALVIFGSGAAVGTGATFAYMGHSMQAAMDEPGILPGRMLSKMRRRLDLTDSQAERILPILERRYASLMTIRGSALDQAQPELDTLNAEIAALLDSEQLERWEQRFSEMCERWLPGSERRQGEHGGSRRQRD